MKKRKAPKTQASLDQFKEKETAVFISSLKGNKLKIIDLLDQGFYGAAVARRLNLSRSYVSKVISELRSEGQIEVEWVNPLIRKATSYRVKGELKNYILHIQKPKQPFTLFIPHHIRYKFPIVGKKKPISTETKRFAASQVKLTKEYCMRGGVRYVFDMKHDHMGHIGIIVHPNSIEVYQKDRHHIPAASIEDATAKMAIAINDVANRFVQEQAWENVHFELGQPELVGSPHYAVKSRMGREITNAGQTTLQVGAGFEIDKSLEDKYHDPDFAEIENQDLDMAMIVDQGLKNAANINSIVPALVREELKSVADQIASINGIVDKIDMTYNSVQALCQSGIPVSMQLDQMQGIVARQGETIMMMQESMLGIIRNMEKLIAAKQ